MKLLYIVALVCLVFAILLGAFSFDSLEYWEIGLCHSYISEVVQKETYSSGRHYVGLGNHFIKFPRTVVSVLFADDDSSGATQGPGLQSRTRDGLNVRLEVSFQYKLKPDRLFRLYSDLGTDYQEAFIRIAIEQLTTASTMYNARSFFQERSRIAKEMHGLVRTHFETHGFASVPFLQLRTVQLPDMFEDAIRTTQVRQQGINIAKMRQRSSAVSFETDLIKAEQAVKVMKNEATAQATSVIYKNDAYCSQYRFFQETQGEALKNLMQSTGWTPSHLLQYLKIRAVREHPSNQTTIRL